MTQILSILLYTTMLALVLYNVGTKNFLKKIGFKKLDLNAVLTAGFYLILMFVVSALIGGLFYAAGFNADLQKVPETLKSIDITDVITTLLIGSIVEELFFRGYLQKKTGILFSTFIFGYFHVIYGSFSEVIGAFFLGLVLAYAFQKTKNLYVPIMAHIAFNLITVLLISGLV